MTELEKNAQNGQAVGFMLIKSADKKISVKGSPYLDMVLSDKGGEIPRKCGIIRAATTNITPEKS